MKTGGGRNTAYLWDQDLHWLWFTMSVTAAGRISLEPQLKLAEVQADENVSRREQLSKNTECIPWTDFYFMFAFA